MNDGIEFLIQLSIGVALFVGILIGVYRMHLGGVWHRDARIIRKRQAATGRVIGTRREKRWSFMVVVQGISSTRSEVLTLATC